MLRKFSLATLFLFPHLTKTWEVYMSNRNAIKNDKIGAAINLLITNLCTTISGKKFKKKVTSPKMNKTTPNIRSMKDGSNIFRE